MCGILAVLGVRAKGGAESVMPEVLERARRLRHRGPDWSGTYLKGANVLAHERLAIVSPESGQQPLHNATGTLHLAVNGEIYNHQELRAQHCPQAAFQSKSDCEIILHLYEAGFSVPAIANMLNGIFAFILLDETKDVYYLCRDHMGIMPLYAGRDKDSNHWIASEMKALHDVCAPEQQGMGFADFTPGCVYDSSLPGANDTERTIEWYKPTWHDSTKYCTTPLDKQALKSGLEAAVSRQLMSDVPYGVLLSGGLDSSLIASIAARICARRIETHGEQAAWWPRLHSFSIGLADSPDLVAAKRVAEHIGTVHHAYVFTIEEGLNAISDVIYHLETYDVTTVRAATPMYLMSRKIKAHGVKMVLSGEGADEMFGGYLYFHKCPNEQEMQRELVSKLKGLNKFDCLRANKSTAAWGVEARVPFLDREFLDYSMNQVSPRDKMCGLNGQGRMEKWALREAFAADKTLLPADVLWRQKEQFSDGVGYSWIDSIKAAAEQRITDEQMSNASNTYPLNTPRTKEAYLIRSLFAQHFPSAAAAATVPGGDTIACSTPAAVAWDEAFKKCLDNSGRSVAGVHTQAYGDQQQKAVSPRQQPQPEPQTNGKH